jgi:hypothetical protein
LLTDKDKALLTNEMFDPRGMMVCCATHQYYGPTKLVKSHPATGCKQCWMVYFLHDLASVPPSERAQRFDEIEEVVRNLNQMVESGKWDYKPFARPDIKIEKDAWPETSGTNPLQ